MNDQTQQPTLDQPQAPPPTPPTKQPTTSQAPPTSPSETAQNATIESRKKKFPWLAIILPLFAISLAAAAFFAYQLYGFPPEFSAFNTPLQNESLANNQATPPAPEVNETANWNTYTNTQYGYSFKLPPGWEFESEKTFPSPSEIAPGNITLQNFTNDTSSFTVFYEGAFDHGLDPWKKDTSNEIEIGDKLATQDIYTLEGNPMKWHLVTIPELQYFRIEANIYPKDEGVVNQILKTFEFTQ